jgi:hypothetical protein
MRKSLESMGSNFLSKRSKIYWAVIFLFSPFIIICSKSTRETLINPIFQFGGLETEPGKQLNRPSDFIITRKNEIVVSDSKDNCIVILGAKGDLIKRIGTLGQGPGELNRPGKIGLFNSSLIVADNGNSRIQILSMSGEYVKSYSFPGASLLALGANIWFSKEGDYYYSTEGINSENLILRCAINGKKLAGYGDIYGKKTSFLNMGTDLVKKGKIPDWYKNRVIPAVASDGSVYCIHRSLPIIKKYAAGGELIWARNLDLPEFERIRLNWINANKEAPPQGSYSLEYWADVDLDEEGNVYSLVRWVQRMTVCVINTRGEMAALYKGVDDNISMICVHGKELWALGGDSHKFYKFIL